MRFLLFGTGDYYERFKKWFDKDEVIALLDNSPQKHNTLIDDIKVISPEEGVGLEYDVIIILSFYVKEMRAQLVALGVADNRIFHFFDLHRVIPEEKKCREIQCYGFDWKEFEKTKKKGKTIALLSHDLTYGGPALALYHVAEALMHDGWQVVFASMLDGPMRTFLMERDIPVIVDENLQVKNMNDTEWITFFDVVFCNTIGYYAFLSERQKDVPVIWWLHDSPFFYEGVNQIVLNKIEKSDLRVLAVGPVPKHAMLAHRPDFEIDNFLYSVKDVVEHYQDKKESILIRFVTIGYMEWRKGQDILVNAIKLLPQHILEQCEFYFVGQNTSMLAQKVKEDSAKITQINITGVLNREEINRLLESVDILVCPSREDPMPTVAAEAMMHSVPCLVSDATGTASYIEEYKNGLVFQSENVLELAKKLQWCVEHKTDVCNMRAVARKTYEDIYSQDAFVEKLKNIL